MSKSPGQFWDRVWQKPESQAYWTQVAPDVLAMVHSYSPDEYPRVLDLGCGLGRHAMAFALQGFRVWACDVSEKAVAHVVEWADELGVSIETCVASSVDDAYATSAFDICVSVNVLYHNSRDGFFHSLGLIRRWLRPGGLLYFTCASREDAVFNPAREVAPNTYELEPGHVHYLADKPDLEEALAGFRIERLHRCEHYWEGGVSSRWRVLVSTALADE